MQNFNEPGESGLVQTAHCEIQRATVFLSIRAYLLAMWLHFWWLVYVPIMQYRMSTVAQHPVGIGGSHGKSCAYMRLNVHYAVYKMFLCK